ncbi:hypothetical protein MKS88_001786 [Plasmodium brasilianum]|uniref:Uncharacterized protein n=1 Tax=Plasmodium brasilianum TaxID=5824 RepID=A0ACB9YCE3_PLABR|nr:hypothetical protein MKS88_001786 [Plasmodium brasilianum]
MRKKFMLFFFFKIAAFIFLRWICPFNSERSIFCNYLYEKNIIDEKLYRRTYRLLTKNKKEKCLNILWEKEIIQYNGKCEKKHIYNNECVSKVKHKMRNKCTSNNLGGYKQTGKCKSFIYNRENTSYGKRMLDKIYYKNVLRYSTNSDFTFLRNSIQRKVFEYISLFIFHLVVGVAGAIFYFFLTYDSGGITSSSLFKLFSPICILWIMVLVGLFYIFRKTVKYGKLLHLKRDFNYTKHAT